VFRLDSSGTLTRYAGTCSAGYSGDGGPAVNAQIFSPGGLAIDSSGNLYIADAYPHEYIRKVSPSGIITTVAGNGISGYSGDGGPATSAALGLGRPPVNIAVDSTGNLYIPESGTQHVRKVSAASGIITTVAGSGSFAGGFSGDGGPATSAQLRYPAGVAVDAGGNIYIADTQNDRVRKVSTGGIITTFACNGEGGTSGDGGAAASASCYPTGVTFDSAGNLYITDQTNARVRKVTASTGIISTVAGGGPGGTFSFGGDGGVATSANFNQPFAAAVDSAGNVYVADQGNYRLRKVSNPGGIITTVAGNGTGYSGDGGPATSAQLYFSSGVAVDSAGNLYIGDANNHRVRKVSPDGTITTVAGNGTAAPSVQQAGPGPGDGGPATSAQLRTPIGVAVDSGGNLYIADLGNFRIRKVSPGGTISTVAGNGTFGFSGDGGPATSAQLSAEGIALDQTGNLYIADISNRRVRKVSPAGIITTVAGTGTPGDTGDGGPASSAELYEPIFVAVDSIGNLYIADTVEGVVRKVAPDGTISTYASGVGPYGVAVDSGGNLYISDDSNSVIRKVSSATGALTTIAGQQINLGFPGNCIGDGAIATQAQITSPQGLAVDSSGRVFIGDVMCNAVRVLTPDAPSGLSISRSGNNQTGQVGWTLPNPLQVVVNGSAGVPVPGVSVNFAVTSGSATVAASAVTDSTGTASVQLTLGATAGSVVVMASVAGLAPMQFNATTIAAPAGGGVTCTISAPPLIASVRSLTDFGGLSNFAPGSWLEVKGSNLAVDTRLWGGSDFLGSNAPTSLDGSSVSIDGNAAFVEYISGGQINVQAPADSATGTVKIAVTTCAGARWGDVRRQHRIDSGRAVPAGQARRFDHGLRHWLRRSYTGDRAGRGRRPAEQHSQSYN
jgi:sugar lactone lactonase YvrE